MRTYQRAPLGVNPEHEHFTHDQRVQAQRAVSLLSAAAAAIEQAGPAFEPALNAALDIQLAIARALDRAAIILPVEGRAA